MKKILSISNSFGVDATRYLHQIAKADGEEAKIVTLYVGGCSLARHHENIKKDAKAYELYVNGVNTEAFVGIDETLSSDEFDAVVFQQASPLSGDEGSYYPFLTEISDHVKQFLPNAKQYIHQTWVYPENSEVFALTSFKSRGQMIPFVKRAYERAAKEIGSEGIIPSLEVMNVLYEKLGGEVYRDGLHASLGVGRYALSCVWYAVLFCKDPIGNSFCAFDEPTSADQIALAQKTACDAAKTCRYNLK